ncbi:hypothetical protein THAOC_01472, partial [Thalassiosira oceanica]
ADAEVPSSTVTTAAVVSVSGDLTFSSRNLVIATHSPRAVASSFRHEDEQQEAAGTVTNPEGARGDGGEGDGVPGVHGRELPLFVLALRRESRIRRGASRPKLRGRLSIGDGPRRGDWLGRTAADEKSAGTPAARSRISDGEDGQSFGFG